MMWFILMPALFTLCVLIIFLAVATMMTAVLAGARWLLRTWRIRSQARAFCEEYLEKATADGGGYYVILPTANSEDRSYPAAQPGAMRRSVR